MRHWSSISFGSRVLLALLAAAFLLACRVQDGTSTYPGANDPGSGAQPPAGQVAVATRMPTKGPAAVATPSRPAGAETASAQGEVAFSLTILHTGETYGEVRPCG